MAKKTNKERSGLVHLDPEKLERQTLRLGLSKTSLAEQAQIKRSTVQRAFRGEGVFNHTAVRIAEALGFDDVTGLLHSETPSEDHDHDGEAHLVGEWQVDRYLGGWVTASNGLQFRICRMKHRFVENRVGRGKWYDLLHLSDRDRESLQAHLVRHPTVCERIGLHPHVSENLSTLPGSGDESWWVIDRWVGESLLQGRLSAGRYAAAELPRLMLEIAQGLEALHAAKIVFRELAPSRVIVDEAGHAVLTDFELAKLLDTGPTVSSDWPDDPYRAPEVESGAADERSDLYSWARILVHALTGELPPKGCDAEAVTESGLPKAVWRVAVDCLAPGPSDRPANVQRILRALRHWK